MLQGNMWDDLVIQDYDNLHEIAKLLSSAPESKIRELSQVTHIAIRTCQDVQALEPVDLGSDHDVFRVNSDFVAYSRRLVEDALANGGHGEALAAFSYWSEQTQEKD